MTPSSVQLRTRKSQCAVDVRIAALPECVDQHAANLRRIFGPIELATADETVWQARQDLFDTASAIVLKVSLLPGEVCRVSLELEHWAANEGVEIAIVAQANGLITLALKSAPECGGLRLSNIFAGGCATAGAAWLRCRFRRNCAVESTVWGCESNALPLMREIKRRFDPNRILNPGRFVGNI